MGKQVIIKPDFTDVLLPTANGLQPFNGGATVVLTDAEYAQYNAIPAVARALGTPTNVAEPIRQTTDPAAVVPAVSNAAATGTVTVVPGWNFITLVGPVTLVLGGWAAGKLSRIVVAASQDATAGRVLTQPGGVKWAGGSAPVLTVTTLKTDFFEYYSRDGGTTVYGRVLSANS